MTTTDQPREEVPASAGASSFVTLQCAQCGKDVERYPSMVPESRRVFCDMDCTRAYRKANASKVGVGSVEKECPVCHGTFRTSPSTPKRYCSPECYRSDRKGKKRNYPKRESTAEMVTKDCAYCGKAVTRRASDSRPRHFCDRSCSAKMTASERTGRPRTRQIGRRKVTTQGYVSVYVGPDHPMTTKTAECLEHRLVMAEVIGRPLLPNETPHHKNLNRQDNRPENLELWVSSQPKGARVVDLLAYARDIIATYEPIEDRLT